MTLAQLRMFDAVAVQGGFAAAARALGVSQPTVSAQVAALERKHGVQLIDRATGEPTPSGAALREITRPLFALAVRAEAYLAEAAELGVDAIRIATDAPGYLMPLLAGVRSAQPEVTFLVTAVNGTGVVDAVCSGQADLGLAAEVPQDRALHCIRLREQTLVAVVRLDHPRASEKTIRLQQLKGERIVGRERDSITRRVLEDACTRHGVTLHYGMTADSREAVLAAVTAGLGVGIVAEDEMLDDPRLVMLDLCDPVVPVVEYLVCRSGQERSRAWRALVAAMSASSRAQCLPPR